MEVRESAFAGRSYPDNPEDLKKFIDFFKAFGERNDGKTELKEAEAVLMPHLELRRIPGVYGQALEVLSNIDPHKRVLIAGVAHSYTPKRVCTVFSSFKTPLGSVETDNEALELLSDSFPIKNSPSAFSKEHSIEFPLVLLKSIWENDFKIIPIIVREGKIPELAEALADLKEDFPFFPVLSVDLSHVGARFGHGPLKKELVEKATKKDLRYLNFLSQNRFEKAYSEVTSSGNYTNIDAYATTYALKDVIEGEGKILKYRLDPEPGTLSAVGAGSIIWR